MAGPTADVPARSWCTCIRLYNGSNNGDLFLSVRDAATALNVTPNTAAKAFPIWKAMDLSARTSAARSRRKTRHATTWILTEFPHVTASPTKDFMHAGSRSPKNKTRSQKFSLTV